MNRKAGLVLAVCASVIAAAVPIGVSVQLARAQTRRAHEELLLQYARNVVQRSERVSQQAYAGIQELISARGNADPCTAAQIARMGRIDLTSSDIQAMGYVANGRLMCSSYGKHGDGLLLEQDVSGPGSREGAIVRTHTRLPLAPDMTFIVVERAGYVAIVHEAIPIDIATSQEDVSLATYAPATQSIRARRGFIKMEWATHPLVHGEASFDDGEYLVAVASSSKYLTRTVAALPLRTLENQTSDGARVLLGFGLVAGLALAILVFLLGRHQMGLPALLRRALYKREFFLLYQPIVNLETRQCIGAEALVRWRRANGQLVAPDVFIPVAEGCGLIQAITQRVLQIVERDAKDIFRMHPHFHIGINLAAADLRSELTVERLNNLMRNTGAGPRNILVEATERGLMDAAEVRQVIRDIHSLGIEVAVDDFGTGYSSLSYLGSFDLDYLKIDKSFVDTLQTDAATSQVALHIIEMAKSLQLKMIAEGVETASQASLLQERGVQYAQGWLFGKPMSMEQLRAHVLAQTPD